jgi:hypothetical protein
MEASWDDPVQLTNWVAQCILDNFGFFIDQYGTIDLSRLARTIDAVGGPDDEILRASDTRRYGMPNFQSGVMNMYGWRSPTPPRQPPRRAGTALNVKHRC